jgi:hypothetical protein
LAPVDQRAFAAGVTKISVIFRVFGITEFKKVDHYNKNKIYEIEKDKS